MPNLFAEAVWSSNTRNRRLEAGDLVIPLNSGEFSDAPISAELGEVVTGAKPGRLSDDEITIFKSIGVAIEDICVAGVAYEKAIRHGVGTTFEM